MQRMRGPKRKKIRELLLEEVKIWLSFEKMSKRKNFWEGRSETRERTQRTWIRGQNKGWLRNYPNWNMLDSVRHVWESLGLYFEGPCWSKESWTWSFGRGGGGWLLRYFKQQNDMVILVIRETTLIAPMWEIHWRGTNGVEKREARRMLLSSEMIGIIFMVVAVVSRNEIYKILFLLLQPLMESSMPTSWALQCTKENEWPGTWWQWDKILTYTLSISMQKAFSTGWARKRAESLKGDSRSYLISIEKEEESKKQDNNQLKDERYCTWSIEQRNLVWVCIPRSVIVLQALSFPFDIKEMSGSFMG